MLEASAVGEPGRMGIAARAIGLSKVYGQGERSVLAVDNVSVSFPSERFTAVMGPSGSGKSTLMHCMAGLDRVSSGQVWIWDTELSTLSDRELTVLRREQVAFVFQAFNLLRRPWSRRRTSSSPSRSRAGSPTGRGTTG